MAKHKEKSSHGSKLVVNKKVAKKLPLHKRLATGSKK